MRGHTALRVLPPRRMPIVALLRPCVVALRPDNLHHRVQGGLAVRGPGGPTATVVIELILFARLPTVRLSQPQAPSGLADALEFRDRHPACARVKHARTIWKQRAVALEGQNVAVEEAQREQLEEVSQRRERHDGPEDGLAEGALVARLGGVQRHALEDRGIAHREGDPIPEVGGDAGAERGEEDHHVAALQRVPLVAEDGHQRGKNGGTSNNVDAIGRHQCRRKQVRPVVQIADVVERQGTEQAAGGDHAGEVAHRPRAPDGHLREHAEDQGQQDGAHKHDDEREVDDVVVCPAVQGVPFIVRLRRVVRRVIQHLRNEEEPEGLVQKEAIKDACRGQTVGAVAVRRFEESHCSRQRDDQHALTMQELDAGIVHDHRQHAHGRPQALEHADPFASHLEAAVEVLVEVPDDEQQPRSAQHTIQGQESNHGSFVIKEVLGQRGRQHREEHRGDLRVGHQQVWRHATGKPEPHHRANGNAGVEDDVSNVVGETRAAAAVCLHSLEQGLARR
mmetsp:Transcript_18608/g.48273  ORF Transcript_18608/g.48273 Transcript_18608/m.48273 type:complete len:508 (+) Transcript_18608:491-2014(+)